MRKVVLMRAGDCRNNLHTFVIGINLWVMPKTWLNLQLPLPFEWQKTDAIVFDR